MSLMTCSINDKSGEPFFFGGVPTQIKIASAPLLVSWIDVEKDKLPVLRCFVKSSGKPASKIGQMPFFKRAIFDSSISLHTTLWPISARHAPVVRPTYPVPITAIFIENTFRNRV